MDRGLRDSLPRFSTLQEVAEKYQDNDDELGVGTAILLHTIKASVLLELVKREPEILLQHAQTEWIGISGGLLTLSALAIADSFETLRTSLLEAGRLTFRVAKLTAARSRATEDQAGCWGWTVLGVPPEDLRNILADVQHRAGVPSAKMAKVAVIGPGWSTVIGPPSVLKLVTSNSLALRDRPKSPLPIKGLQHTLPISSAEIDYMVGLNNSLLEKKPNYDSQTIWGMMEPTKNYLNWRTMLREICYQVLARPLNITQVAQQLCSRLHNGMTVRVVSLGSCSHVPYFVNTFKEATTEVFTLDEHALLDTDNKKCINRDW